MELELDFNDVPDVVKPVEPGQYFCEVSEVGHRDGETKPDGSQGRLESHTFKLMIAEGPMKGKLLFDDFPVKFLGEKDGTGRPAGNSTQVRFKDLLRSAGLAISSRISIDELKGKSVQLVVSHRNYKDRDGNEQTQAQVKQYLYAKTAS